MQYVHSLDGSTSPTAGVPSDDRMVAIYGILRGELFIVGARYRLGRWIGGATGNDLTDDINACEQVVWAESYLSPPSAMGTLDNCDYGGVAQTHMGLVARP